jgi:2-hydroxy-3-keto-5-methylthiopentenyl-1-phosphate phosphatase
MNKGRIDEIDSRKDSVQTPPDQKLIVTWLDEHSAVTEKNRCQKYTQINHYVMFMACDGAGDFTAAVTDDDIVT